MAQQNQYRGWSENYTWNANKMHAKRSVKRTNRSYGPTKAFWNWFSSWFEVRYLAASCVSLGAQRGVPHRALHSTWIFCSFILLNTTIPLHGRAEAGQVIPCSVARLVLSHWKQLTVGKPQASWSTLKRFRIWGTTLWRPTHKTYHQGILLKRSSRSRT